MSAKETQISSAEIYKGHIINVYKDDISIEGGGNSIREVVRHKGAAAVLAVDKNGEAFFVEQFRYPIGRPLFEVPAGKIDEGETPLECAKRELLEECGIEAEKWTDLGPMLSSPGFCDEVIHLFFAEELSFSNPDPDEDEFLDIIKLPLSEVLLRLENNEISDAKTQVLILRGCRILGIK